MLGAASLIVWTLTLEVLLKYCFVVLRADDRGQGGWVRAVRMPAVVGLQGRVAGGAAYMAGIVVTHTQAA